MAHASTQPSHIFASCRRIWEWFTGEGPWEDGRRVELVGNRQPKDEFETHLARVIGEIGRGGAASRSEVIAEMTDVWFGHHYVSWGCVLESGWRWRDLVAAEVTGRMQLLEGDFIHTFTLR